MKATDLLKRQHREVEALFEDIEAEEGEARAELVRELAAKLAAHMRIEEEVVYPLARDLDDDELEDQVLEALEEHTVAAFELKRAAEVGLDHESSEAKLKTLKDLVAHHVEEEERTFLPKLERYIEKDRLEAIGADLESRFEDILESGYGAELFDRGRAPARGSRRKRTGRRAAR
jgi:hemerythrin superfamily protein